MLGNPKFKFGDKVKFANLQETKVGIIEIIDANGSWAAPNDPSYDILTLEENGPCLYKHVTERNVNPLSDEEMDEAMKEELCIIEANLRR